jgi:tetratricopeptide (TPR) repeat protein
VLLVGEEHERTGNDAVALQTYRRILTTYAGSEEFDPALFNAIELLARTKKYDDALEIANRYLDGKELSATTRSRLTIRKAELQLEAAKPHNAVTTMKEFIADNPNDPFIPNANYTLGKAYGAAGDVDNSVSQFQHVIATYPESDAAPFSHLQLARMEVKRQNNDAAARYYTQAFDWKYYSSDAAPISMAEYGAFVRNTLTLPDSALKVYSDLTSRYLIETSAGTNAQLEVVDMLLESNRTSEAVSRLEVIATARKGERAGGEARLKLASLYRRQSQWKKALAEYDKARKENTITNDQLGRSLAGSAQMHYALGDKRSARIVAQELLAKGGLPRQYRLQAEQLIDKISPKKQKKGKR